jgi:hypothetical protein
MLDAALPSHQPLCWALPCKHIALPASSSSLSIVWTPTLDRGFPFLPYVQVSPPMFAAGPPESVKGKFAMGGRVNAYVSSSHTYAPNFDMELYHWPGFGLLFMYLNLVPRRSLVRALRVPDKT